MQARRVRNKITESVDVGPVDGRFGKDKGPVSFSLANQCHDKIILHLSISILGVDLTHSCRHYSRVKCSYSCM